MGSSFSSSPSLHASLSSASSCSPAPSPSSVTSSPPPPPSSSATSPPPPRNIPPKKYHVFLSFRGEDTREKFISHLYSALIQNQIITFLDDQLIKGDKISQNLLNAIEGSKISVVILSKRYASSRWCFNEFVKILECKEKYGQIVIPVFYRIDPSDVRYQIGTFGDRFFKLEERLDKVQTWRSALTEIASLSGFVSHVIRPDSLLVKVIVEDILKILNQKFPSDVNKDLVGVESRIKEVEVDIISMLNIKVIDKMTIADAIFKKISSHFDGSYFLQNVREEFEKSSSSLHLQREPLSMLFEDRNLNVGIPRSRL